MKEKFKRINGFENEYLISNWGRVVRLSKARPMRQLKWMTKPNGYCKVELYKNNKRKDCYIHRLVAEHFIDNPDPLILVEVEHRDGNKRNNSFTNLKWCTHMQNMRWLHGDEEDVA